MKERDNAIDVVITALKTAEPSVGFEARMHHALQHAPAAKSVWRTPFVWMATAALLLCAVAIGVGLRTQRNTRPIVLVPPVRKGSPLVVALTEDTDLPRPVVRGRAPKLTPVALHVRAEDEEMTTHENIPPPPLPLTQEEKLVIRMMRHNDLPQLATLSTDARASSLHDDAESYREFFAPRPPLNGQPNYEQHIITGGSQ